MMPKMSRTAREVLEFAVAIAAAFIVYQGFAFALGTSMPMVSVVSDSMLPALHVGDLMIVQRLDSYGVGDIVVYDLDRAWDECRQGPIIHRIIAVNTDGTYETKGDHNPRQLDCEHSVRQSQIAGRARFAIPLLGYPRLALFAIGI